MNQSIDTLDDTVWKRMIENSRNNTEIFRKVFACIPDDMVGAGIEVETFQAKHSDLSQW